MSLPLQNPIDRCALHSVFLNASFNPIIAHLTKIPVSTP